MLMYYDVTIGGCVAASRCLYDKCVLLEIPSGLSFRFEKLVYVYLSSLFAVN